MGTFLGAEGPALTSAFPSIETTGSRSPSVGLVIIHMLSLEEPQKEGLTVSGVRVVAADGVFSPLFFHLQQKAGPVIHASNLGNPQSPRKSPVASLPSSIHPHTLPATASQPAPLSPTHPGWEEGREEGASPPPDPRASEGTCPGNSGSPENQSSPKQKLQWVPHWVRRGEDSKPILSEFKDKPALPALRTHPEGVRTGVWKWG